mgnify:CR=1 FL=1
MIQSGFEILGREFPKALIETLQMMAISMAVSAVFGLLLGFVLFLDDGKLKCTAAVVALLDVAVVLLVMFRGVQGVEEAMFPHLL